MSFGPFLFAAPGALLALLALPVLFFIMRATPPPPQREQFPPARLLEGLRTDDQSRERAPWWLVLFRMLAAALLILAFARPSLAPQASTNPLGGRTLIIIDDGWTSAPAWSEVRNAANAAIAQAERARAPILKSGTPLLRATQSISWPCGPAQISREPALKTNSA